MGPILLARDDKYVELHIVRCEKYIQFKGKPKRVALKNIQVIHPLQLVHLDYLTIEVTEGVNDVHMLIITYHSQGMHKHW